MSQNRFLMYLNALGSPFKKRTRLEFLNPDDSIAFALDNNPYKSARGGYNSNAFIQSGSLNVSLNNGQRRSASITLANLDGTFEYAVNKIWYGSRVRLSMGLVLPDGSDFYLPQGVFYFKDPSIIRNPTQRQISYSLVDKWSYLDGSLFGNLPATYVVEVGENIFSAMSDALRLDKRNLSSDELASDPNWMLDPTTPVFTDYYNHLPDISYTVTTASGQKELKTAKANETAFETRIEFGRPISELLLDLNRTIVGWVGYDSTGAFRVDPSQDDISDIDKPILWTFTKNNSLLLSENTTVKNREVYNDIIIVGEDMKSAAVYGRATNFDPRSDCNVNLIGMKTFKEARAEYWNETQCRDYASWLLKKKTILQKSITISSSQMFHLNENSIVAVERTDLPGSPVERHLVQSFSLPIGETGQMSINATSINQLNFTVTSGSDVS